MPEDRLLKIVFKKRRPLLKRTVNAIQEAERQAELALGILRKPPVLNAEDGEVSSIHALVEAQRLLTMAAWKLVEAQQDILRHTR